MGFINYPKMSYNGVDVSNILFNINIIDKENHPELFLKYYIKEEDTPESVAYKIYEDPSYSWLVFALNNMTNPIYDWPFNAQKLETYVQEKYNHSCIFIAESDIDFAFSSVTKIKKGTTDYYIKSYDRSLNVINLAQKISTTAITTANDITLYNNTIALKTLKPKRIVYEGVQSLHHFEENGKVVSTRDKLTAYLNGNENYLVTNFDYEYNLNENKKYIQLLDPRLILKYESQMKNILSQIENRKDNIENE